MHRTAPVVLVIGAVGADGYDEHGKAVDPSTHILNNGGDLVFGKLTDADWYRAD